MTESATNHQPRTQPAPTKRELEFELVEFTDVPEPIVAAHIPMQED